MDSTESNLGHEERNLLLRLARESIRARVAGQAPPEPELSGGPLTEHRGAFVTLTIEGALRGCIGHVVGVEPLWRSVSSNAIAAAFRDPRFSPVQAEELERIAIEISVMSPLERLADPSELVIGRHGLLVEQGQVRGLLLPQVAADNNWDRATFLDQTCRKAGLEPGCWRHETTSLYTFTVENFEEE
jgi:AmmeMemoRadiSam system protein A